MAHAPVANGKREAQEEQQHAELEPGEKVLDLGRQSEPHHIDHRKDHHNSHRQPLPVAGVEPPERASGICCRSRYREGGEKMGEILGEGEGRGGNRRGESREEGNPSAEKAPDRPPGLAQEDVLTA